MCEISSEIRFRTMKSVCLCESVTCYLLFQDVYLTLQAPYLHLFVGARWHSRISVLQSLHRLSGLCNEKPVCLRELCFGSRSKKEASKSPDNMKTRPNKYLHYYRNIKPCEFCVSHLACSFFLSHWSNIQNM